MTAPVRIDATAWGDLRFATLARLCGFTDAEHALIKCARIWAWQTEHYTEEQPTYIVDGDIIESALGPDGAQHMVRARLAEEGPGGYRIKGSSGRIEWLLAKRIASAKGGEATKRKHENKWKPAGPPQAKPPAAPEAGPNAGPRSPDLPPSDLSHTPRAIVRTSTWHRQRAWWDEMLAAHDRLRAKGIKPNTPDLAKHPNEPQLVACERFLRDGGYDDESVDAKMRHVVLVYEAEAEALGHLDFFKPAIIWDTTRPDRFPRKVDTSLEEARTARARGAPSSRASPRGTAVPAYGASKPRPDHPNEPSMRSANEVL